MPTPSPSGSHRPSHKAAPDQPAALPPALACNACGRALGEVHAVDTQALRGIDCAFQAHCAACDQDTWAVRGQPAAVRAFYAALEAKAGHKPLMGTAKPRGG